MEAVSWDKTVPVTAQNAIWLRVSVNNAHPLLFVMLLGPVNQKRLAAVLVKTAVT